jgi:type IV pilus assembly protein PilE
MDHTKNSGFTLIELMITIGILAIIVGVAIPSYQQYVLESGRADAKTKLLEVAQTMERCFTRYQAYNDAACPLAQGDTFPATGDLDENDKYQVTVTTATATTFDLTAAPRGSQTKDTECVNFTLSHAGVRGYSGTGSSEDCW